MLPYENNSKRLNQKYNLKSIIINLERIGFDSNTKHIILYRSNTYDRSKV